MKLVCSISKFGDFMVSGYVKDLCFFIKYLKAISMLYHKAEIWNVIYKTILNWPI